MSLLCAILTLALTRAELVDRFRATPVTQMEGLVRVYADCPREMRQTYQMPVASFVSKVCRKLYASQARRPQRFPEPGIVVYLGDLTNAVTNVVVQVREHANGTKFTRIALPAPGYSDQDALCIAVSQGFFRSVLKRELSPDEARRALEQADPEMRVRAACRDISAWRDWGAYLPGKTDEDYLAQLRKVLYPGILSSEEARTFASRLYLYPLNYGSPFCGKYTSLDFADAVNFAPVDPAIRLAALIKARQLIIFGAGRGEGLSDASEAYSSFLLELSRGEKSKDELRALLTAADEKLKGSCK